MSQNILNFLQDSLKHHRDLTVALDRKASFLIALSGVIFGLSVSRLDQLQFIVIAACSLISVLLLVMIIRLPFRGKIEQKFSLLCWWGFKNKKFEEYSDEIDQLADSKSGIIKEYKKEIWNLAEHSLKPKNTLLKWASLILSVGLLAGFIIFFF